MTIFECQTGIKWDIYLFVTTHIIVEVVWQYAYF